MQVSNVYPANPTSPSLSQPAFNSSNMDVDMDLDISLDVGESEEAMNVEAPVPYVSQNDLLEPDEHEPFDSQDNQADIDRQLAPEKVHIRGLDNLTTNDVKAFISEHSEIDYSRLEWIDDTSANIVYESSEIAISVLSNLVDSSNPIDDSSDLSQLRKATSFSTHPNTELSVRLAFNTDVKRPRAREASRFYLMNPEHDPLERRRRRQGERGDRRGERRYDKSNSSRRRQRSEEAEITFDESMYDEQPDSLSARIDRPLESDRSNRRSSRSRDRNRRGAGGGDLFGEKTGSNLRNERLRDRSASPLRDGDGRFGFDEGDHESTSRRIRQRSHTPPSYRHRGSAGANSGKELMDLPPTMATTPRPTAGKELFPANGSRDNKELFPRKTPLGNHRRKLAFDAGDETADLFADRLVKRSPELRTRSLSERITGGPATDSKENTAELEGINIRGTAGQASQGFSIRGSAQSLGVNNPKVKELFPERGDSNGTKDLFEGRIAGRGGQRRRAEDLF